MAFRTILLNLEIIESIIFYKSHVNVYHNLASLCTFTITVRIQDDVNKWKHFPRNWAFVRGIHRSPHKGQWRGALMFSLICVWINDWVNNREAGDLRRYRAHYDVIVMCLYDVLSAHDPCAISSLIQHIYRCPGVNPLRPSGAYMRQ